LSSSNFLPLLLLTVHHSSSFILFLFNDFATSEIYTLSLHDALPIYDLNQSIDGIVNGDQSEEGLESTVLDCTQYPFKIACNLTRDRKSTRLNSSHVSISYAVFCLKKKKSK